MATERYLTAIQDQVKGRFELQTSGAEIVELLELAPEPLNHREVVRLRRSGNPRAGWRTLLIASLRSTDDIKAAARWAADVRDRLLEPETADLYLLLLIPDLDDDDCLRIEADEQFCRKFVARRGETEEALLNRTFLAPLGMGEQSAPPTEPLAMALARTAAAHPWLDTAIQEKWRAALLSGQTGSDLATALLSAVPPVKVAS